MSKEQMLEFTGVVIDTVRGAFKVSINVSEGKQHVVLANISGKLRKNLIHILKGDKVKIEVSPYDLNKGRITYRMQ